MKKVMWVGKMKVEIEMPQGHVSTQDLIEIDKARKEGMRSGSILLVSGQAAHWRRLYQVRPKQLDFFGGHHDCAKRHA